jgi:alkylation response protein AidB-like acyl-CoA dehydrogenase
MTIGEFIDEGRSWLDANVPLRKQPGDALDFGDPFSAAVFHSLSEPEERALLGDLQAWQARKAERGYHAIAWPAEFGGLGLAREYAAAFAALEGEYETPTRHELFSVTTRLVAPTVHRFGTPEQQSVLLASLLRADVFCCQLFSEPAAGSDFGALGCRAVRDDRGDDWIINGQKVWSSGAQFAEWGLLIARTDPDVVKHRGLTAFLLPMATPGVEVRPIRQMSGGSSFNEVFLTDAHIPDRLRLGDVGSGWEVALTTLGFERDHSGSGKSRPGGSWQHVLATARHLERTNDAVTRQELMKLYTHLRVEGFVNQRAADLRAAGARPGPEGSLGKLLWTEGMRKMSDVVSMLVGPALVADTGRWATYAWSEHVLGAPGYRIAGGTDEVQRNIIGERVLGLPAEPRTDKDVPWRQLPR